MGYWDATEKVQQEHGGKNPTCPIHHCKMYPQDDHGRFFCPQCGLNKTHDFGAMEED